MGARVGFLGLGRMGRPMSENLLTAGFKVTVWNRTIDKTRPLADLGATVAHSPVEAAAHADILITMLENGPIVEKVLFESTAYEALPDDALVVDMSSIKPTEAQEHAARLRDWRVAHLDAPVSGGVSGAKAGTLAIMVGGTEQAFARAAPVLRAMGRPVHVGPSGAGQLAKLANQIIVGATIGAVAEALMLAEKGGADCAKVIDALAGGFADSKILQDLAPRIVARDFAPRGRSVTHLKDIENAIDAAGKLGLEAMPFSAITAELFHELLDGAGDLDHAALRVALDARNGLNPEEFGG